MCQFIADSQSPFRLPYNSYLFVLLFINASPIQNIPTTAAPPSTPLTPLLSPRSTPAACIPKRKWSRPPRDINQTQHKKKQSDQAQHRGWARQPSRRKGVPKEGKRVTETPNSRCQKFPQNIKLSTIMYTEDLAQTHTAP